MSMILDALSRAEKERQTENISGLDTARYVTSSTIKDERFKRWVLVALVANFVLIAAFGGIYFWKHYAKDNVQEMASTNVLHEEPSAIVTQTTPVEESYPEQMVVNQQPDTSNITLVDNNGAPSAASLIDEAKVKKSKPVASKFSNSVVKKPVKKTPPVQYSSQPLSQAPSNAGASQANIALAVGREQSFANASGYTKLTDLPVSQRSQLSQYEINVHVYDDNPQSRFVLIDMVKYKEGDKLSGAAASVASIVPEGVVLNYANQQVLIERNK